MTEVAAEAVFVELFVGLAVPKTAGVGRNLVGKNDFAVMSSAEFQLEIDKLNAETQKILLQNLIDLESKRFNSLNLFFGRKL